MQVGFGHYGTCCAELDIWEANAISTQMTVHGCNTKGQTRCEGVECGDNAKGQRFNGTCDKDGCDFNPYRVGATQFYGPGSQFTLDTNKPMTVVTQFITDDGTDTGALVEMRRFYVQDGKRITNPKVSYGAFDSISDAQCTVQKSTCAALPPSLPPPPSVLAIPPRLVLPSLPSPICFRSPDLPSAPTSAPPPPARAPTRLTRHPRPGTQAPSATTTTSPRRAACGGWARRWGVG